MLAVAAVLLGAGCGGDGDPDPATISDAASATLERGGVRAKGKIWGSVDEKTGFVIRSIGTEDAAAGLADYRLRSSGFVRELGGELPEALAARVVRRGSVVFALDPGLTRMLRRLRIRHRDWLQIEYADATVSGLPELTVMAFLLHQSPARLLHYARGAETEERGGETTVAGARTTLYRGRVDLDAMRNRAPEHQRGVLRRDVDVIRAAERVDSIPIDAWTARTA